MKRAKSRLIKLIFLWHTKVFLFDKALTIHVTGCSEIEQIDTRKYQIDNHFIVYQDKL